MTSSAEGVGSPPGRSDWARTSLGEARPARAKAAARARPASARPARGGPGPNERCARARGWDRLGSSMPGGLHGLCLRLTRGCGARRARADRRGRPGGPAPRADRIGKRVGVDRAPAPSASIYGSVFAGRRALSAALDGAGFAGRRAPSAPPDGLVVVRTPGRAPRAAGRGSRMAARGSPRPSPRRAGRRAAIGSPARSRR